MLEVEQPIACLPGQPVIAGRERLSGYIPSLDGWRAVAILWVILAHNQPWHLGPISNSWLRASGDRGVMLFFALSGYLICTRLLREEERFGKISLRSFYTRRLFRIQPAALVYLAVVSVLMLVGQMSPAWICVASAAAMVRNILPVRSTNWETAHFWTLAVEEHFYLFLPGFLVLCRRYRTTILMMLIVGAMTWRLHEIQPQNLPFLSPIIYLRTDMAIGWILMGAVFGLSVRKPTITKIAAGWLYPGVAFLYIAAVFLRIGLHTSRWDAPLLMTVFPPLILATVQHPASLTTRFLELAPVRFLGRISYSLYLWQQLFFNFYVAPAAHTLRSQVFLCWCLLFACAVASYYLIETPLIRVGHRIAKRFDRQRVLAPERVAA